MRKPGRDGSWPTGILQRSGNLRMTEAGTFVIACNGMPGLPLPPELS